jgi:dTMP kinase
MTDSGFFLVVEGLDGSGKSEMARRLRDALRPAHDDGVLLTYEPHDPSCAGTFIRQVLTHQIRNVGMRTLALAFAANRMDHLEREIQPFLAAGSRRIVIGDRYYLSSLVYQVDGGVTFDQVLQFNAGARPPDLTVFLDASPATCAERMQKRAQDRELFEVRLEETRQKYLFASAVLRARGEVIADVDANRSIEAVFGDVVAAVAAHGPSWLSLR